MSNNTAFIFARSGSKELPNKNIKIFKGKPLITHTINLALRSQMFKEVIVFTDSEEVKKISLDCGAKIPFERPASLSKDDTSEWICWQYVVNKYREKHNKLFELFFSLPCTSPLRSIDDIKGMIDFYQKNNYDLVLGITKSSRSPYFNMVHNSNGVIKKIIDGEEVIRRQDSPICFDITTTGYVCNPNYILNNSNLFSGKIGGYELPKDRSIDIDDDVDFHIAEALFKNNE